MTDNMETNPSLKVDPSRAEFMRAWPAISLGLPATERLREEAWSAVVAGRVKFFTDGRSTVMARIVDEAPSYSRTVFAQTANGSSDALSDLLDEVTEWARANGCTTVAMHVAPEEASNYEGFIPTAVSLMRVAS